jgi:hypothetical protein
VKVAHRLNYNVVDDNGEEDRYLGEEEYPKNDRCYDGSDDGRTYIECSFPDFTMHRPWRVNTSLDRDKNYINPIDRNEW